MGELFMIAGIVTAIILCFVGIVKLPFSKFKANKPKLYKATFTLLSIVLSVGACIITQMFVLEKEIYSTDFAILLISTIAGVFGLYSSYEGLGLKNLVKNILEKLQELSSKAPESKFTKYIDKIGVDKAIELINEKKQNEIVIDTVKEAPIEQSQTEQTTNV